MKMPFRRLSPAVPATSAAAADGVDLDEFLDAPRPSRTRRWIKWGLVVLGVVLLVLLLRGCLQPAATGEYLTKSAARGDLTVTVSATGTLKPTNEVQVGSEQSGIVTQVFADNNDRVTKGQPLARLDTSRLTDAITQNRAALNLARAQVDQAQATAQASASSLARLENVYKLSGGKVPSLTELDNARADRARTVAAVRAAQASVVQAEAQLSSAQINLTKATIYSPVTGVVLSRQIDPGQTVAASFTAPVLFTIAEDLGAMKLEVQVDEADVGLVEAGQAASFAVDAYPGRRFPATVERVDVGSDGAGTNAAATTANQVVSYTAVLSVRNDDGRLRPGMTATAEIVTQTERNQLLVANEALRWQPEKEEGGGLQFGPPPGPEQKVGIGRGATGTVYVLGADGTPQSLPVRVGVSDGTRTAVTGGALKAGQKVVVGQLVPGESEAEAKGGSGG